MSSLLFGPRAPRASSLTVIDQLIDRNDWASSFLAIGRQKDPEKILPRFYRQALLFGAQQQHTRALEVFSSLGIVPERANTIICENDPRSGLGCCHWDKLTIMHLVEKEDQEKGPAKEQAKIIAVCGQEISQRLGNNGGWAQKGSWHDKFLRNCPACQRSSDFFQETRERIKDYTFLSEQTISDPQFRKLFEQLIRNSKGNRDKAIINNKVFGYDCQLVARRALAIEGACFVANNKELIKSRMRIRELPSPGDWREAIEDGLDCPTPERLSGIQRSLVEIAEEASCFENSQNLAPRGLI
jgi:hypothetical protein